MSQLSKLQRLDGANSRALKVVVLTLHKPVNYIVGGVVAGLVRPTPIYDPTSLVNSQKYLFDLSKMFLHFNI